MFMSYFLPVWPCNRNLHCNNKWPICETIPVVKLNPLLMKLKDVNYKENYENPLFMERSVFWSHKPLFKTDYFK